MKPILVTGGAGFVGARLTRRLVERGHSVALLTRARTDLSRIKDLLSRLKLVTGDLTDRASLDTIVREVRPRGVFHLAVSNMQSGVAEPDEQVMRANILGTVNLISAMAAVPYAFFINTGSFLEYRLGPDPVKESDRCEPMEFYSITKLAATLYGQMVARRDQKPIVTFRVFSPYGPAMQRGRLMEAVISKALRNEDIAMTDPQVSRDFIFADDIADLCVEAMDKASKVRGEVFNAGTGVTTTLKDFIALVLQMTGSKSVVRWNALKSVSYDRATWQADMTKTFSHFTWRPKHSLKSGLAETIAWMKEHRP